MAQKSLVDRISHGFSLFIRISLVIAIVSAILNYNWLVLFVSVLTLFLTFLPAIIKRRYRIYLPAEFEILLIAFIYASLFLGEVHDYYTRFWWWDAILHGFSGLALGFIGFLILFVLYEEKKIKAKPGVIAMFSFCFGLAIGALWEIFEFAMDSWFGLNMQKSGLVDTMWDLIVDAAGSLISAVTGYLYLKGGRTRIFRRFFTRFISKNPRLFSRVR